MTNIRVTLADPAGLRTAWTCLLCSRCEMPLVRGPIPQSYAPRRGRGGARLPKRPNHMHRLSIRLLHLPAAYLRTAPRALCCLRYVHAEGSVGTVCASWRASCGGARAHARAARAGTDRRLGGGTDRPARPFAAPRRSLVHAFGRCCRPSWRRGHGCRSARSSFRERNPWKLCARLPGCWQALLRRRVGALHCEAAPGFGVVYVDCMCRGDRSGAPSG